MTHKIGDIVTPNPDAGWARKIIGARYVITDLPKGARGTNYKAAPCDAEGNQTPGQSLRSPEWALVPAPAPGTLTKVDYVPLPAVGSIVKSTHPSLDAGAYTVIGHTDATRVRIIKVGDVSGRYYRAAAAHVAPLEGALDALDDLL